MLTSNAPVRIEILGINLSGGEIFNPSMTTGISLVWLQDTQPDAVWETWGADYRDLIILDAQNRVSAVFNLTEHDLRLPQHYEEAKRLLLVAAASADTDNDKLSDDWEQLNFRGLSAGPQEDADQDGETNLKEFTFGTNPKDAASKSSFLPMLIEDEGEHFLGLSFRRRGGAQIRYIVETSTDLLNWNAAESSFVMMESFRNLFDGTGTGESTCRLSTPMQNGERAFIRVRGEPR